MAMNTPLRALSFAFASVCATTLAAQPTLTSSNYVPVFGMEREYECASIADPGPVGADAIWDFSTVDPFFDWDMSYYDHTQDQYAADFPNATHGGNAVHADNFYYAASATGIEMLGFKYYDAGLNQPFFDLATDPLLFLPFPCAYGTAWDDDGAGTYRTYETAGVRTYVANITGEATGYGTLILPNGTYNDVLRVDWVRYINVNNLEVGYEWTMSSFYLAGFPLPVAEWERKKTWILGELLDDPLEGKFCWLLDPAMQLDKDEAPFAFSVTPNPAEDQVVVQLGVVDPAAVVSISDAAGRLVMQRPASGDRLVLDIADLQPGAYQLSVMTAGTAQARQFIKL